MLTAKVFANGRSQAVRLPKEYRFRTDEVAVSRVGQVVMLFPKTNGWDSFLQAATLFTDDFMEEGRAPQLTQEREGL